jgi:hydrogenase expression/formation protein HypC
MCLAVPGKITEVYESGGLRMGRIDFGGVAREACLEYVPEAEVGDYTVIHVGFAISVLSEEEANATLELIREIAAADPSAEADGPPDAGFTAGT